MEKEFLSIKEVSVITGFSPWTLRGWIRRREIEFVRFGRNIRITRKAIEKMIKKCS